MLNQEQLIHIYKQACNCDIQAFKPGNVSIYNPGHDMSTNDFILSSDVSVNSITNPKFSLGEKIFYAVKATKEAVECNTNLGIILLCAPLFHASQQRSTISLRKKLNKVLSNTSVEDAAWVFKAITLASPGGLGNSKDQDVNNAPAVTLTQAMEIASKKDRIALQYVTDYKDIFEYSILRYNRGLDLFDDQAWAVALVFSGLLSKFPDSHIERKFGEKHSGWVLEQMNTVDDALLNTDNPKRLIPMLHEVDREFKAKGINPGTTADLTVATVAVFMMEALSVRCTR